MHSALTAHLSFHLNPNVRASWSYVLRLVSPESRPFTSAVVGFFVEIKINSICGQPSHFDRRYSYKRLKLSITLLGVSNEKDTGIATYFSNPFGDDFICKCSWMEGWPRRQLAWSKQLGACCSWRCGWRSLCPCVLQTRSYLLCTAVLLPTSTPNSGILSRKWFVLSSNTSLPQWLAKSDLLIAY